MPKEKLTRRDRAVQQSLTATNSPHPNPNRSPKLTRRQLLVLAAGGTTLAALGYYIGHQPGVEASNRDQENTTLANTIATRLGIDMAMTHDEILNVLYPQVYDASSFKNVNFGAGLNAANNRLQFQTDNVGEIGVTYFNNPGDFKHFPDVLTAAIQKVEISSPAGNSWQFLTTSKAKASIAQEVATSQKDLLTGLDHLAIGVRNSLKIISVLVEPTEPLELYPKTSTQEELVITPSQFNAIYARTSIPTYNPAVPRFIVINGTNMYRTATGLNFPLETILTGVLVNEAVGLWCDEKFETSHPELRAHWPHSEGPSTAAHFMAMLSPDWAGKLLGMPSREVQSLSTALKRIYAAG